MARSPRRKPGSWSKLAHATRKRYRGAGITRQDYYAGVSLQAARGHRPKPPPGAADETILDRVLSGEGTMADLDALTDLADRLAGSSFHRWIPTDFDPITRAALSRVDLKPDQWGRVRFHPRGDDEPWDMIITPKGAPRNPDGSSPYDRRYEIPGGGGVDTAGAREILDWLSYGDDWADDQLDWDVEGS